MSINFARQIFILIQILQMLSNLSPLEVVGHATRFQVGENLNLLI